MKKSSVYLLIDNQNLRLKIGKANDLLSRWKAFGYAVIDFSASRELICQNEQSAHKIERMLHNAFHEHKIPEHLIGNVDGKDEWFYLSIVEDVIELIELRKNKDDRMLEFKCGVQKPTIADIKTKTERLKTMKRNRFSPWEDENINEVITALEENIPHCGVKIYSKTNPYEDAFGDIAIDYNLILRHDGKRNDILHEKIRTLSCGHGMPRDGFYWENLEFTICYKTTKDNKAKKCLEETIQKQFACAENYKGLLPDFKFLSHWNIQTEQEQ